MIIKYFAWLKNITKIEQEIIDDPFVIDINTLKKQLTKKYPKLQEYLEDESLIRFAINMTYTYKNEKIKNDDEIALFPPLSGG